MLSAGGQTHSDAEICRQRCAIYTRKSSEEGLEQSFNSLDAQREACEAFVRSQAHEGWQILPEPYDDGGFSGGNIERPALARLLSDIREGMIDLVVVYKVDRLSRSLADFVRLIELFDKLDVSFVSVTQQFNTSTSMGRLTLNVLLSFAQFEREVTSERIRDKIDASKKKGLWMGGLVPLGYDRIEKQLVVNDAEARVVNHIYQRYLALGKVRALKAELDAEGYRSKRRPEHHTSPGGLLFSRGALYTILKSPVYLGKVHHKGELYDGNHAAIVDSTVWKAVQDTLKDNRSRKKAKVNAKHPSLLSGLVFDDQGNRMTPTYTRRKKRHYAYYISQAVLQYKDKEAGSVTRLPGKELEQVVCQLLMDLLGNTDRLLNEFSNYPLSGNDVHTVTESAGDIVRRWPEQDLREQIPMIQRLVTRVNVSRRDISVALDRRALYQELVGQAPSSRDRTGSHKGTHLIQLHAQVNFRRSGIEAKLVYPNGPLPGTHKRSVQALQQALYQSLQWNEELLSGKTASFDALLVREGLHPRQAHRLRKLAFLAPDILESILSGNIPESITLERLKKDFPLDWQAQRQYFGIAR